MISGKLVAAIMLVGLLTACSTLTLWESTNPRERILISANDITQAELDRRRVKYERYDSKILSGYLVEKSAARKFRDYTFRALGTPVTITIDAVTTITVIGVYGVLEDPTVLNLVLKNL